jgi:hypothetical protein
MMMDFHDNHMLDVDLHADSNAESRIQIGCILQKLLAKEGATHCYAAFISPLHTQS